MIRIWELSQSIYCLQIWQYLAIPIHFLSLSLWHLCNVFIWIKYFLKMAD